MIYYCLNEYNGLDLDQQINIQNVNYDDLVIFINDINEINVKYVQKDHFVYINNTKTTISLKDMTKISLKDMTNFKLILTKDGENLFHQIKNGLANGQDYEMLKLNRYYRLIVYLICKIFMIKCETIKTSYAILLECSDFLPINKNKPRHLHKTHMIDDDDMVCGCRWAPYWFDKENYFGYGCLSSSWANRIRKSGIKLFAKNDKN